MVITINGYASLVRAVKVLRIHQAAIYKKCLLLLLLVFSYLPNLTAPASQFRYVT